MDTSACVEHRPHDYLTTFSNHGWDSLRAYFDDEATVFFPRANYPTRATGRDLIERVFLREFEETRAGASGPAYLDLRPQNLLILEMGDTAVVSFHVVLPGALRPRTVALRKRAGEWKTLHLRASNTLDATTE
jgi:hypothetical protein